MLAFLVPEEATIATPHFTRHYLAGDPKGEIPLERLIVDAGGESDFARKALDARRGQAPADGGEKPPGIALFNESHLLQWNRLPPRIGRVSTRFAGSGLHLHEESAPLRAQLAALRARHPQRRHFRLAVVNAFGTNLGDCVLGMAAMRQAAAVLGECLPGFVVDMLLGANANPANFDIVGHEPWIGRQLRLGPTLLDFARYDAYFDFSNLIALPRFAEMPVADWYLWWFGLDPAAIPSAAKRNTLNLPWQDWNAVAQLLRGIPGRRVLFNPAASVPLRSFPQERLAAFVTALLRLDKDLRLVVDRPLGVKHARLVDLAGKLDSPHKFAALVAQMDGQISVDTFGIHVADAANVPTVCLTSSVPPGTYPCYPFHEGVPIPGAQALPAWRKAKVGEADWAAMKDGYAEAWGRLDPRAVLAALKRATDRRAAARDVRNGLRFIDGPHRVKTCTVSPDGRLLPCEAAPADWSHAQARASEMARTLLRPGHEAVLAAPGQSRLALAVARRLGADGTLHLYEPRPERRALIAIDLLDHAAATRVRWHDAVPLPGGSATLPDEDPLSETSPAAWGNTPRTRSVPAAAIDTLALETLGALFVLAPLPFLKVLESASATLARTRAAVVCAPLAQDADLRQLAEFLIPRAYQCWVDTVGGAKLLLALPAEAKVNAPGLKRIVLEAGTPTAAAAAAPATAVASAVPTAAIASAAVTAPVASAPPVASTAATASISAAAPAAPAAAAPTPEPVP